MRLVISASVGRIPQPDMGLRAAEAAVTFLKRVAKLRSALCKHHPAGEDSPRDTLTHWMIRSVSAVGDASLTPMAAVAGAIADAVADFLAERGMTKVIINNGGDIAIRLRDTEPVRVGIRPEIDRQEGTHILSLDGEESAWGVATSGLGGRSLSRGVASAVTVIARKAALADAAATAIANASFIRDPCVVQRPAREIDPETDIPELPVTIRVGPLNRAKKARALSGAMEKANRLIQGGLVHGAMITVQGETAMTPFFRNRLTACG
jgi:hypothetical protein